MRRLERSPTDKKIFGVCGGLGEYFGVDPVIVRVVFLIALFCVGGGLLAYILMAIIMPMGDTYNAPPSARKIYRSRRDRRIFGVCGGISEYFNMDVTVVRILVAVCTIFGIGLLGYIIAAIVIPSEY